MTPRTLYQKIWDDHIVRANDDGTALIYIDCHLIHEVTSPQAFDGLRLAGRKVRRPHATFAVMDHNVPTLNRAAGVAEPQSRAQIDMLRTNCNEFGIPLFDLLDRRQGIVHVIGPEQGLTQPGMVIVCGDSHTSTHGAFGALAFGIGTSEVEHVLATQTLILQPAKNMRITIEGSLPLGITAKDMILTIIGKIGTAGGTGHVIEYAGPAIRDLSMEGRMTICNMSIEAGAKAGLIAPDETTFRYIKNRPFAPDQKNWEAAIGFWQNLYSDADAMFDREITLDAATITPQVSWGTTPEDIIPVTGHIPSPDHYADPQKRDAVIRMLSYMDLHPGLPIAGLKIDRVFIGSCTNGRIEDLRDVAKIVAGKKIAPHVKAMIVPGSGLVKAQAEQEGIASILIEAGFEWRDAGCSMCLGMNEDQLLPGERCASTSNRNFEGRQGKGGRTHLMSPAMAAAAALAGEISDVRFLNS